MIGIAMKTTIETLFEQGKNKSEISRITGHDWKTVAKVIKNKQLGIPWPSKKRQPSKLDPYKSYIMEKMENQITYYRIWEKLRKKGLSVGYSTVKDYCSKMKRRENIFIRIHTEAGKEAQVDFGYCGYLPDEKGKRRKAWVFNMRLSHSRFDYYEIVFNQRVETFINCHIHAFEYFGGVPEVVKIDNLKAAILEANFYEPIFQRQYLEFSEYYKFKALPCRVYRPNDKGKVESGIKYFKNNFIAGRKFTTNKELNYRLKKWLEIKCNSRVHGTTRKVPFDVFREKEQKKLIKLPSKRYELPISGTRKVYHDCHIYVDYNYYSVPFEYVGKVVEISLSRDILKIRYQGKEVALHARLKEQGEFSTNESHYPKYKVYAETEYQEKYQVKMSKLGEYAEQMFFIILKERPNMWKRIVSGILSLEKRYSKEIVNLACKRAIGYGVIQYQTIKNICANGSWKIPVDISYRVKEDINHAIA